MIRNLGIITIICFIAMSASAKIIYIDYSGGGLLDTTRVAQVTMDPQKQVWNLMAALADYGFNKDVHILAKYTADGFVMLNPNNSLGGYGSSIDAPVLFYILLKRNVASTE